MANQPLLRKSAFLSAFFIIILGFCTYAFNLQGFFILDDYPNFYGLAFVDSLPSAIHYITTAPAGERWLAYASYLLHLDAWQQGDAFAFKLFNLILHAANAVLLYCLLLAFSKNSRFSVSTLIALFAATLWFVHPVQVNAVLYSVQRMTLLSGFFVLLGLLYQQVVFNRHATHSNSPLSFTAWLLFSMGLAFITVLGVLSKENAILLPALGFLLLHYSGQSHYLSRWQKGLTYASPYVALMAYLLLANRLGFSGRNFDMGERLLSQVLILKEYLHKLLLPTHLSFSLYYDGFEPVRSVFETRFLQALIVWFALIAAAIAARKKAPYLLFALLWFLLAHALESSIIPLELYFDHRNYLASMGVILALLLAVQQLMLYAKQHAKPHLQALLIVALVAVVANWLYVQYREAALWSNEAQFEKAQITKQPNSLRAMQGYVELLFAEGSLPEAVQTLEYMHQRFGYHPTHIIYQAIAACLIGAEDKVNHDKIVAALSELAVDRSVSDAMQSMLELVQEGSCESFTLAMFERYSRALLANPTVGKHAHNVVFLLMQAHIDAKDYEQAFAVSQLLADRYKSQQFYFLQLGLAVGLKHKQAAEQIYAAMLQSKQVNQRLFAEELRKAKRQIEALD